MGKTWRFWVAHGVGKLVQFGMRILKRRGSYLPGSIVLKIDPLYLAHVGKPSKTVAVSGTNGKTTVSNMVTDYLRKDHRKVLNNSFGSNTKEGIAATFLEGSTLTGKAKHELGIIELDERSAIRVFPMFTPDFMLVTNLFRDSYARNAHAEFIFSILDGSIPSQTKMILNAEDPISNRLALDNPRTYYGMPLQTNEVEERESRIKDLVNCPICHHTLAIDFIRYNHIGRYRCTNCNYVSPDAQYTVLESNLVDKRAVISNGIEERHFHLATSNIVDLYNVLSATAILQELGMPLEKISKYSEEVAVVKSRFDDNRINGYRLLVIMAKGGNPIASSRTFAYMREEPGKKAIVLLNGTERAPKYNIENMGWIYDNDFSYLNDPSIDQIICCGRRYLDFAMCLRMAGIPEDKIILSASYDDIASSIDYKRIDTVAILRNFISDDLTEEVKTSIKQTMEGF